MENGQVEKAKDFVKQSGKSFISRVLDGLKKTFTFAGRASRADFWSLVFAFIWFLFIEGVLGILRFTVEEFCIMMDLMGGGVDMITLGEAFKLCLGIANLYLLIHLLISIISASVRRLHDLGLSGFWLWYLSSFGLPIVFVVNFLNLDDSCNMVLDRFAKTCNSWVAWIVLPLFWLIGAPSVLFLLFLYKGRNEENMFGQSPYANL